MSYERDRLVRRFVGLVLALGVIGSASPVWAWGDLGHKIVCEIALQELNESVGNISTLRRREPPPWPSSR